MSEKSLLVETHSSPDGYAWRTVYVVGAGLPQLRELRDEFQRVAAEERPKFERNGELPGNSDFASFFVWLRQRGVQIEYGPRGVYGLDNPTPEQSEAARAARAVIADVEFSHASEPPTPLSVI